MAPDARRTVVLGVTIAALGLVCIGGGLALLAWRMLAPDDAVLLPPQFVPTAPPTPTVGVLRATVEAPPLPADVNPVAILPISERPTATGSPTATLTSTATVTASPTRTATATRPLTHTPSQTPRATRTTTITATRTLAATVTPSNTATSPPTTTRRPSPSPSPTHTSSPTATRASFAPERIVIGKIGLDAPIVPVSQQPIRIDGTTYSQWAVPDERAAGWHQNSAALGQPGNLVLNGHHNVYGEVFHDLRLLEPGDVIEIEGEGRRYVYMVAQTMTLLEADQPVDVRQDNARWILPTNDERITLVTCWPQDGNSHRLVVIALSPSALGIPAQRP